MPLANVPLRVCHEFIRETGELCHPNNNRALLSRAAEPWVKFKGRFVLYVLRQIFIYYNAGDARKLSGEFPTWTIRRFQVILARFVNSVQCRDDTVTVSDDRQETRRHVIMQIGLFHNASQFWTRLYDHWPAFSW